MGRFYRTANPQFLDYMYELPKEAMMKAIENTDAQIAKQDEANQALKGLLKLDAIDKDKPYANQLLTGYEEEINKIAQDIQSNPLQYRRMTPQISDLQTRINKDFTRGEAFQIQSNYNTRLKNYEAMKEAYTKSPDKYRNFDDINSLQTILDNQYQGFQKGAYNTDRLREYVDIKEYDKYGEKYEAEIKERLGAFKGKDGYLYTSKDYEEKVDPKLIQSHLIDILMSDQKLNDYYRQQIQLGNLSEEDYITTLAETATRIGEKYGYEKTSKGLLSIKNDSRDAVDREWELNNPIGNTTPGLIYDNPLMERYAPKDAVGNPMVNNTVNGLTDAIEATKSGQREQQLSVTKLAGLNNIELTPELKTAVTSGDFLALKGVQGTNGEVIDPQILYQHQQQYDQLMFDQQILNKKREIANGMENPDEYLAKTTDRPVTLANINEFQNFGIVSKENNTNFHKNIKEWRKELDESQGYFDAPLRFDVNDRRTLPPGAEGLQGKLQDGVSINDLIANGTIKVKQGSRTVTGDITTTTPSGKKVTTQGDVKQPYTTAEYENFKVNGEFAKPATQLSGDGEVLVQYEINIDGYPINVYMEEKYLSNKTIKQYMDMDAMKAAHQYMEATSEGVIDEKPFVVSGVDFKKVNGNTVAQTAWGTVTTAKAIQMIAAKRKADREKFLSN